jgi:Dyp-type peroxidase family
MSTTVVPVTLEKPADQVDITSAEYSALLRNLQANILWAHGRNFARHVFLRFTGSPAAARTWIRDVAGARVTTARQQLDQIITRETNKSFDGGLVSGFFLSAKGYEFLGLDTRRFEGVFRQGMKSQNLNPLEGIKGSSNKDPSPSFWEAGFRHEIHALITVADATENKVKQAVDEIRASAAGIADVLTVEEGTVLRRTNSHGTREPVEHFGYFDGISNPVFTRRDLAKEFPENQARASWDPGAPLILVLADDPHTAEVDAYGSYLVYRKLGQDVRLFDERVKALAAALKIDEKLAGAMVVGRFKDGTPVARANVASPGQEVDNDFSYREDKEGVKCPFHAHIRKANPRGTTPATSLESERKRRVVRRGIPYGKPMKDVADGAETNPDPAAPRGLLFLCFQRDIDDQFEFIQRTWVDNVIFPRGILFQKDTGDDPLIGQDPGEPQQWPSWGKKDAKKKPFNFESAVTLKGGEYFFAPSVPFLRSL